MTDEKKDNKCCKNDGGDREGCKGSKSCKGLNKSKDRQCCKNNQDGDRKPDECCKGLENDECCKNVEPKTEEEQQDEYLAGWKRALADYENLKRDMNADLEESRKRIKTSFAHNLLPVADNFHQAVNHAPELEDKNAQNWLQGVIFIEKQLEEVMQSLGLEKITTIGETFDPNLHESAGARSEKGKKDQEILEEVQAGWKLGESIIRPAKVIINEIK